MIPTPRISLALVALVLVLGLMAGRAGAQSVDAAVDDLRGNDVTFEEGAATPTELALTAEAAASFAQPGAFFKVVVLASGVTDFRSAAAYAEDVLAGLGGSGRVQVIAPDEVGIASNVDDPAELPDAESAALVALDSTGQPSASVIAAGDVLGVADPSLAGSGGGSGGDDDGSGGGIMVVLVVGVLVVGGIVAFLWFVSRNNKRGDGGPSTTVDVAAQKVRAEVDTAANLVIELNDAQELPGFTDEARTLFREGATLFADLQDDLEEADTRPELEAVWPQLKTCTWKLAAAKAVAAGQPAPAQPPVEPLIPQTTVFGTAPAAPGGPVVHGAPLPPPSTAVPPPPPVHYQQSSQSPWLSQAAVVAMSVLAAQGIGNARQTRSGRDRRPPSDDDWFGSVFGGGGGGRGGGGSSWGGSTRRSSGGGTRSRPSGGGRSGRVGKGMGRRR